jgi:CubicO group peptidase (beta-lactamase class C family)
MPSTVTGLKGYQVRRNNGDSTYTLLNDVPTLDFIAATALTTDTSYSGVYEIRAIDNAGNPTAWVPITGSNIRTTSSNPAQSPMSPENVARVDKVMAACQATAGPGTLLSIKSEFGYLTKAYGSGVNVSSYYRIASQTKMYTAMCVMIWIDRHLLTLDTKISDVMSGYPNGDQITVAMLLNHTSGLFDYELLSGFGQQFTLNPALAYTVDQVINIIKTNPPTSAPGTAYAYSNSNYYVLGKLLEATDPTARPLDQIFNDEIFVPLGMSNTYMQTGTGTPKSPYVTMYDNDPIASTVYSILWMFTFGLLGAAPVVKRDVSNQNSALIWAAGAIITLVTDATIFGQELIDGTLLSPDTHDMWMSTFLTHPMTAWGLHAEGPTEYGYGYGMYAIGGFWRGHVGSWLGTDSATFVHLDNGMIISTFNNFQYGLCPATTTQWYELAEEFYPGSTSARPAIIRGHAANTHIQGGQANVIVNDPGFISAQSSTINFQGGKPEIVTPLTPSPADIRFTGGQPSLYSPVDIFNVNKTNEPIPIGATVLRIKKLRGPGGNGASGTSVYNSTGGSGGGSGAVVPQGDNDIVIPVSALDSGVYTTIQGTVGHATEFICGSTHLVAGPAGNGIMTTVYNTVVPGGSGGTWSADGPGTTGVVGHDGLVGGYSHMQGGGPGASGVGLDVAGSGAGGRGSYNGLAGGQQAGGSSDTVVGGTGPTVDAVGDGAGPGGGEGREGGDWGAGGGGGLSQGNVGGQAGGPGSLGLIHVRWE